MCSWGRAGAAEMGELPSLCLSGEGPCQSSPVITAAPHAPGTDWEVTEEQEARGRSEACP